jgi:hypothetical protein
VVCFDGFEYFDRAVTGVVRRCSKTGAVHLHVVDCVHASSLALEVERLLALRPRPSGFIAGDDGDFKGGDSALRDIKGKSRINLARAQSHFDTKFQFTPPGAPCFRGLVEKFIDATRAAIHSAVHARTLADEGFSAVFGRAMGRRNNVPMACTVKIRESFQHLDSSFSKTSIVVRCSTTGAVHLDMMDCVDTFGFLLAVSGWLVLRPRPSVFMADGSTSFGGADSAVQDVAKKGPINLARAQSHFDTKFRFAPRGSSTFAGSCRRICWRNGGGSSLGSTRRYVCGRGI